MIGPAETSRGEPFARIIVNPRRTIGDNCNLTSGVTLGGARRGENRGTPTVGDGVFFGQGAKVIGSVKIGSNVAVGTNCVVTHDVPDNAVGGGVPARIISYEGAQGYVINTDYEPAAQPQPQPHLAP
ncbi:MAG: hypothetical protein JXQ73_07710 [Phycisphaerae bacterium]|nr:hypothetical protein [Phycisphaerae bacterium]